MLQVDFAGFFGRSWSMTSYAGFTVSGNDRWMISLSSRTGDGKSCKQSEWWYDGANLAASFESVPQCYV